MSSSRQSGGGLQSAFRRAGRVGIERGVVAIERGAIRADDLLRVTHVEKDVGMIEWRRCADALELLGADLDHGHAWSIVKMRNDVLGHGQFRCGAWQRRELVARWQARGTITACLADS